MILAWSRTSIAGTLVKTGSRAWFYHPRAMPGLSMWSLASQMSSTCFYLLLPLVSCRQLTLGTALGHTTREVLWNALVPAGKKGCEVWSAVL